MISISDGLDTYLSLSKETKDVVYEKNARRGVFFRHSRHFSFVDNMIKVLLSICNLNGRVNNYVSCLGKSIDRRNESTIIIRQICSLCYCIHFLKTLTVCFH